MESATVAKRSLSQIQPVATKRQEIEAFSSKSKENEKKINKSKVGRKPLNTEAPNKRIAQNRAAQRAFQERKERKMKNLEEKVQELETLNKEANTEAEFLRLQVQILSTELSKFKSLPLQSNSASRISPSFLASAVDSAEDLIITKDKYLLLYPWSSMNLYQQESSPNTSSSRNNSIYNKSENNHYNSSTSPNSDLDTSTEQYVSIMKTIPQINDMDSKSGFAVHSGDNANHQSENFDEQSFCSNLSMACGTKDQPVPLILQYAKDNGVILKSSLQKEQRNEKSPNQQSMNKHINKVQSSNSNSTNNDGNNNTPSKLQQTASVSSNSSIFLGASPMSSDLFGITGFQYNSAKFNDPSDKNNNTKYNNGNNQSKINQFGIALSDDTPFSDHKDSLFEDSLSKPKLSLFNDNAFETNKFLDGLDFLKDSEAFRDTVPQDVALFNETEVPNGNIENDLTGLDDANFDDFLFDSRFNKNNSSVGNDLASKANNDELLFTINNNGGADDDDNAVVPAKEAGMMKCGEVWDRLTSHVKYTELDIDGLCEELRTKARCSDKGPLITNEDFEKTVMNNLKK